MSRPPDRTAAARRPWPCALPRRCRAPSSRSTPTFHPHASACGSRPRPTRPAWRCAGAWTASRWPGVRSGPGCPGRGAMWCSSPMRVAGCWTRCASRCGVRGGWGAEAVGIPVFRYSIRLLTPTIQMLHPANPMRHFFSQRLIWLALLLSMGIGAMVARTVWTMREDEWDFAARTNGNLVVALEQSVGWTLRAMDQSLQDVVAKLEHPGVMELPQALRNLVLFNTPLRVAGLMDVYVVDSRGNIIIDSAATPPRTANYADRDYFQALMSGTRQGLVIGNPVMGRVTQTWMLPVARAYQDADGKVAGVVVSSISLHYFNELFSALQLGPSSGVNLILHNGIIVSRYPYGDADVGKSLAGTENMRRILADRAGSFTGVASLDQVERFYTFRHVWPYPIVVNVGQSTESMLAHWKVTALQLIVFALVLMASCVGLAILFVRELQRRQQVSALLQEAEHDMHTIMDNLPSVIGYWDAQLRNRFANQAYVDWFGITPEALRGKHISELLGAELYAKNRPYLDLALQGHPQVFERTLIDAAGMERYSITSYAPDFNGDGVRGIFVQVTDITERKRMEDELFREN